MIKRLLVALFVLVLLAYAGAVTYLYLNQRAFFFFPDGRIWEIGETALEATTELVTVPSADGETVTGWYAPPREGLPTILYFKGNAGSFSAEYRRFETFAAAGYGFLAFDYRGFPASPGGLTQDTILADSLAAYDWLAERGGEIVIWGRSLGAAPAVFVASRRAPEAVLLETPFYSAVSVAAERYPYAPVGLLMLDQFRSNDWIGDVTAPVFIVHGTEDDVIPVGQAERLYREVPNPYGLWIEEGGDHVDLWQRGLWGRAQAFFEAVVP